MVFLQKLFANFSIFAEKAKIFFVQILVLNEVAISAGWELAKKFGLEKQPNYLNYFNNTVRTFASRSNCSNCYLSYSNSMI
jgi:hypothetical protein